MSAARAAAAYLMALIIRCLRGHADWPLARLSRIAELKRVLAAPGRAAMRLKKIVRNRMS